MSRTHKRHKKIAWGFSDTKCYLKFYKRQKYRILARDREHERRIAHATA